MEAESTGFRPGRQTQAVTRPERHGGYARFIPRLPFVRISALIQHALVEEATSGSEFLPGTSGRLGPHQGGDVGLR